MAQELADMTPGEILAEASVAEFIKLLGLGIAEAQTALDENSVNQIAHFIQPRDALDGKSLLDIGLSPAFYHYQHADISTSLQVQIKVEKALTVDLGLGGDYSDTDTEDDADRQHGQAVHDLAGRERLHRGRDAGLARRVVVGRGVVLVVGVVGHGRGFSVPPLCPVGVSEPLVHGTGASLPAGYAVATDSRAS